MSLLKSTQKLWKIETKTQIFIFVFVFKSEFNMIVYVWVLSS